MGLIWWTISMEVSYHGQDRMDQADNIVVAGLFE